MRFTVSLTPTAKQDVRSIVKWIEQRSRTGAERWYRRWLEVIEHLKDSADRLSLAPENEDHEVNIQQILFKTRRGLPYRALFVIRESEVTVLCVRGPGQDLVSGDDLELPE